jgi:hypothetical protein
MLNHLCSYAYNKQCNLPMPIYKIIDSKLYSVLLMNELSYALLLRRENICKHVMQTSQFCNKYLV